jgi:hypothetical protein
MIQNVKEQTGLNLALDMGLAADSCEQVINELSSSTNMVTFLVHLSN